MAAGGWARRSRGGGGGQVGAHVMSSSGDVTSHRRPCAPKQHSREDNEVHWRCGIVCYCVGNAVRAGAAPCKGGGATSDAPNCCHFTLATNLGHPWTVPAAARRERAACMDGPMARCVHWGHNVLGLGGCGRVSMRPRARPRLSDVTGHLVTSPGCERF